MRIVLLGDLHGNMPATLAMEKRLKSVGADEIWFLGDAVGKGPENAATCDWVRAHCQRFVGGNWDYGIGGKQFPADDYYWDQLGEERMRWLNNLPRETVLEIGDLRFRVFHGRPVTELLLVNSDKADLTAAFSNGEETFDGIVFADSHRPFVRTLDAGYAVNTGSIGNSMGVPRAHALLMEDGPDHSLSMTILSVPYDNAAAAQAALNDPHLPFQDAYVREVMTGVYSR